MEPYLIDVPVKVNIWIRTECQKLQFQVIKKARPSILFLQSDGGRNESEWKAIYENRKLFDEGINWDCQVYRLYEKHNNGMYSMGKKTSDLIWSTVDRCIFLEDDYIPSVSYFKYCAELLEKYAEDERILAICGMNHEGISPNVQSDYFFSRAGSIWGMATWKRIITLRNYYMENTIEDSYTINLFRERTKHNKTFWKQFCGYSKNEFFGGHPRGAEYWYAFDMYSQSRMLIVPTKNMINNIGCTDNSAHAADFQYLPKGIRKVFHMKTYELKFPIKHPKFVMPDVAYEKRVNRIMGRPLHIKIRRKIESAFLFIRAKGINGFFNRIFQKQKRYET